MGGCYGWLLIGACNPMVCPIYVLRANISCACKGSQGFCSTRGNCSAAPACTVAATKNTTVVAVDAGGAAVGSHTLLAAGAGVKMEMVIDVPSKATGTGEALYLDGQDVAFIRVQLVDRAGILDLGFGSPPTLPTLPFLHCLQHWMPIGASYLSSSKYV